MYVLWRLMTFQDTSLSFFFTDLLTLMHHTNLWLWPRINVFQPPWFASPFSALLPFICSVGPWTSPSTGCRTFCVRLSCGSRQQWRTEHPYTQSNKVKDIEKQWLYSKNKLSGSNLTSAVWTVLPLEERCRLLPRLKQCPQMSEVKCLCCVIIPQLKPPWDCGTIWRMKHSLKM